MGKQNKKRKEIKKIVEMTSGMEESQGGSFPHFFSNLMG